MKERRIHSNSDLGIYRGAEGLNSRTVRGYALVFDSESVDLGGFTEKIERGSLDGVIEASDVVCVWNHDVSRGLLARSKNGEGSLSLEVDDKGLRYEFEAPKTALGDELLENLRRGDIDKSSFCFTVGDDVWEKRDDGSVLRTIKKIDKLFDVAPVVQPAYEDTEVVADTRGLNNLINNIDIVNMENKNKRSKEEAIEKLKAILAELQDDEQPNQEQCAQPDENDKSDEDATPDTVDEAEEEVPKDEVPAEDEAPTPEEQPKDDEDTEKKGGCTDAGDDEKEIKQTNVRMNKKFSLLKAVRDVVNGRSLDEVTLAINKEGRSAMQKAGLNATGNILIPLEARAEGDPVPASTPAGVFARVEGQGKEVVATDKIELVAPLRNALTLTKAGAQMLTGLVGDVSIPRFTKSVVGWKGEAVAADETNPDFDEVLLQPKRITAVLPISRQFILQDGLGAEQMLQNDLIQAVAEKLEATILGAEAGDANKPAGLFNGVTADTSVLKFDDIVDAEASLEALNFTNYSYILNPKAKAIVRKTRVDTGSGRMVMEDGEIEGRNVLVTNNVVTKGLALADWSQLVIGSWGSLSITVDTNTLAAEDMIRLVVNMYVDAKWKRDAYVTKILK